MFFLLLLFAFLVPEEMEDPEMPGLISDSDEEEDPDQQNPDQNMRGEQVWITPLSFCA